MQPPDDTDHAALTQALQEAQVALAVERARAQEANERARVTAETLREATVALTRSLDRETVLTTLLEHLRRLVPFDRASVMVLEEASRVSVRAVFDGERVKPLLPPERPEFLADEHPVLRRILSTGATVVIPDTRELPDWTPPIGFADEASWLGVPLFARGSVAGLFSLAKRETGYFNDEHLRLAETLSSQASVAVENAILFEQMQAASARMQVLSRRLVEVQEDERRTVARELHDEAGQALMSLRFGLQLLERETGGGDGIAARVAELKQTTDAVIDSLHRLAAALRPPSLDMLGLDAALRQYLGSIEGKSGLVVRYKARGLAGERLSPPIETALYRIVQEAVTNVMRHARATCVDVLAARDDGRVLVVVEDDGIGFATGSPAGTERLGLVGMRERAQALGGTLTIESAPGSGTTVAVEVRS
ncbi:MAG TPA: GAF domain-containing sensor histidine kinase [Thermoanaerobaculia bacterium]|nr:GAF domain-containing sensor histidine kinase [Thermoanaerobaculia bacterium]